MRKLFVFLLFTVYSVQLLAVEESLDNQKMNLDVPTSNKFSITDLVWPATIGDAHVSLWAGDKVAAVTITIDDNIEDDHAWWLSMQQKYDLDFTWFIITNRVSDWDKYQALIDAGHEVQPHDLEVDYLHCDLAQASDKKYLTDITLVRDTINQQLTNNQALVFAYPCGQQRNYLTRDIFIAMRGVRGVMNFANKTNYLDINSRSATNDTHDLDILLDPNEDLWNMVFYRGLASYHYHKVQDKTATEAFLSAVSAKSDSIWVGKFTEVAKYGQERDSHTLTVDLVSANNVKFTLTDEMNDTHFDYPLTIKIRVDNAWQGISSTQNGKVIESKIVTHDGNSYAIVKAVPDNGQVTVAQGNVDLTIPQAKAGANQTVIDEDNDGTEAIILDGSESNDSDGTITTYQWFEAGTLLATGVQQSIVLPIGSHQITLKVTDDSGKTATDEVVIIVEAGTPSGQITLLSSDSDQGVYSGGGKEGVGQSAANVGGALPTQDEVLVLVFQLPVLGTNERINSATLDVNLLKKVNNPEGNVDLYGLRYRNNPTVLPTDYFQGDYGTDLEDATPLQDDYVTSASQNGWQTVDSNGQANLVTYLNAQYQLGAKGGDYVFIRLNPDVADVSSFHYWEFATANSDQIPVLTVTTENSLSLMVADNKWIQIGLDTAPPAGSTVADIIGDDISAPYGTEWVLYSYETSSNTYKKLSLTDTMHPGVGYWFIQTTGHSVIIDMPETSTDVNVSHHPSCTSTMAGCFEIALQTNPTDTQWQMIGYPFRDRRNIEKLRVVSNSGVCTNGCTLSQVKAAGLMGGTLWNYDGNSYLPLTDDGSKYFKPWDGAWAATLPAANGMELKLLIPAVN